MLTLKRHDRVQNESSLEQVIVKLESNLELLERNYKLALLNLNQLKQRVEKDDLTQLLRRQCFAEKSQTLLNQSYAFKKDVCFMMIDIDFFKSINDNYGHQTGDLVLEKVSAVIKSMIGIEDFACRYGGEEVVVAFSGSELQAYALAEKIRVAVQNLVFKFQDKTFSTSISIGLSNTLNSGYDGERLVGVADKALYLAKQNGRNRTVKL